MNRLVLSITIAIFLSVGTAIAGSTSLVSTKSQKNPSNGSSSEPSTSETGKIVAFVSLATTLDGERCNNGFSHIFVRDQGKKTTRCVSVNSNGNQADQDSHAPAISSDGQFIAFDTAATNLSGGKCDNGFNHVFVHDRSAQTTRCVSINSNGNQGNQSSHAPAISSDGQFVAFDSAATNLSGGKCDNGFNHVFVHDRAADKTICVSVNSDGGQGNGDSFDPSISADGQVVVFHSTATNLTGRCDNGNSHVYVHDLATGKTTCVSLSSNEVQGDGNSSLARISRNGLFVAFQSNATNLSQQCNNGFTQIFVRDLAGNETSCVSKDNNGNQGNLDSLQSSISSDGRWAAFSSAATNLVSNRCTAGNRQIFIRDRAGGKTSCASLGLKKLEGNGDSANPSISDDGRSVSFESVATNLVKKDLNGLLDIFARTLP